MLLESSELDDAGLIDGRGELRFKLAEKMILGHRGSEVSLGRSVKNAEGCPNLG